MCTEGMLLLNVDQYPQLTLNRHSILNQHLIDILVSRQSVNRRLTFAVSISI